MYFQFSIKPFAHHGAFSHLQSPDTKPPMPLAPVTAPQPPASPPWLGRSIATSRLRLIEHSAFVDLQSDQDTYQKHLFVHIGSSISYSDPHLEVRPSVKYEDLLINLFLFFSLLMCGKSKTSSLKSLTA